MSKQAKTYVLLGLVLLIWGIIGFKVVNGLSASSEPVVVMEPTRDLPKITKKKDTFTLIANYRDPFLGTTPVSKKKPAKKPIQKTKTPKRNIIYAGLVSQNGSANALFFVSIDGKQHIMSKNEEIDQVKLLRGNGQQIKVRYNGKVETIALTE